jgi:hypothetical protein
MNFAAMITLGTKGLGEPPRAHQIEANNHGCLKLTMYSPPDDPRRGVAVENTHFFTRNSLKMAYQFTARLPQWEVVRFSGEHW